MKIKLLLLLIIPVIIFSQDKTVPGSDKEFMLDAIVFKGDSSGLSRLDVYLVIPYETLEFIQSGDIYGNKYDVIIDIFNINTNVSHNEMISKVITADDYYIAQGGSGEFDYLQKVFYLKPGDYRLRVTIHDKISGREYDRSRRLTLINYDDFDFSLSGILLVSSIEEDKGKFKLSPHISDDIGSLNNDFFAFIETYNQKDTLTEATLIYEFLDDKDNIVEKGELIPKSIPKGIERHFIKIPPQDKLPTGNYTLRIIALKSSADVNYSHYDYMAITERSVKIRQSLIGNILQDIDKAIRQLVYIAYQDEIKRINDAPDRVEKEKRFLAFWQSKDPTPNTQRNEAFNEYYSRISYANRNFKSYTEGWMTDMGMVYTIYGPPFSAERQTNYNDNRAYELWRYRNNREFLFVDNSGFGDYRLYRPATVTEKYEYGR